MFRFPFAVAAVAAILSAAAAHGQVLHAIIIIDKADKGIAKSVAVDEKSMVAALTAGLPKEKLKLYVLKQEQIKAKPLLDFIRGVEIDPRKDPVLVYYSGHGGFDTTRGHFLYLSGTKERVYRSELTDAITKPVSPPFYALITDCCANRVKEPVPPPEMFPIVGAPGPAPVKDPHALLTNLFFNTTGKIDIQSSRADQYSFCHAVGDTEYGGVFTHCLTGYLWQEQYEKRTWDHLFGTVRERTAALSQKILADNPPPPHATGAVQRTQTAYSFDAINSKDVNGFRLGIGTDASGKVTLVQPNSAAAKADLRIGDQVVAVNGVKLGNDKDISLGVQFSPRKLELTIQRPGAAAPLTVKATLPY